VEKIVKMFSPTQLIYLLLLLLESHDTVHLRTQNVLYSSCIMSVFREILTWGIFHQTNFHC